MTEDAPVSLIYHTLEIGAVVKVLSIQRGVWRRRRRRWRRRRRSRRRRRWRRRRSRGGGEEAHHTGEKEHVQGTRVRA